jgi:hypothetical protein
MAGFRGARCGFRHFSIDARPRVRAKPNEPLEECSNSGYLPKKKKDSKMNDTTKDIERLGLLQRQYTETQSVIITKRAEVQRLAREAGECRISHIVDPENFDAKATQNRIKQLETDLAAAERQIQKSIPEAEALAAAIARIESDVIPRRHAERVREQTEIQQRFRAAVIKIRDAASALQAASQEAFQIRCTAGAEYRADVAMEGQPDIRTAAGLPQITWDSSWIDHGQTTQRDNIIGLIWDFDRSLVDASDPVSLQRLNSENNLRELIAESERKQRAREAASHAIEPHPLGYRLG